jgi:hypothetical protein
MNVEGLPFHQTLQKPPSKLTLEWVWYLLHSSCIRQCEGGEAVVRWTEKQDANQHGVWLMNREQCSGNQVEETFQGLHIQEIRWLKIFLFIPSFFFLLFSPLTGSEFSDYWKKVVWSQIKVMGLLFRWLLWWCRNGRSGQWPWLTRLIEIYHEVKEKD